MSVSSLRKMSSAFTWFANMSIKAKIFFGFALTITVIVTVGAVGYTSFERTSHDVDLYAHDVEVAGASARVEAEFLRMQTHVSEFALVGHDDDRQTVEVTVPILRGHIEGIIALVEHEPDIKAHAEDLRENFELYVEDFGRAAELQADMNALLSENLQPNGNLMIAELDEMIATAAGEGNGDAMDLARVAKEHALWARMYTYMMIVYRDQFYSDRAHEAFLELEAALADLGEALWTQGERAMLADLETIVAAYKQGFDRYHEDINELDELLYVEMNGVAEKLTDEAEWLQATMAELEHEAEAHLRGVIASAETTISIVGVAGIVLALVVAWLIGTGLSRPIIGMTGAMTRLADGNKTVDIPGQGRKDEIGAMAGSVLVFKENLIRNEQMAAEAVARDKEAKEARARLIADLAKDLDAQVMSGLNAVASASTEIQTTANGLAGTAEETSAQSTAVAAAAEQATGNVQTVASAAEELGSSIGEINRQVQHQGQLARQAADVAGESAAQVEGLAAQANKIGEVVELITTIAEQTNLLALNATIEAARAGDAGKGFAVVASEVKSLANQTAKATEEIAGQIKAIQDQTATTVQAMGTINEKIAGVTEVSSAVAAAVEEQDAATQEIGRNVQQAAAGTQEVTSNIHGVNEAARETGGAAADMLSASGELAQQAEGLKTAVQNFLTQLNAA